MFSHSTGDLGTAYDQSGVSSFIDYSSSFGFMPPSLHQQPSFMTPSVSFPQVFDGTAGFMQLQQPGQSEGLDALAYRNQSSVGYFQAASFAAPNNSSFSLSHPSLHQVTYSQTGQYAGPTMHMPAGCVGCQDHLTVPTYEPTMPFQFIQRQGRVVHVMEEEEGEQSRYLTW